MCEEEGADGALLWWVNALLHSQGHSRGNALQPASRPPNLAPKWEWSWAQEEWRGEAKVFLRFSFYFSLCKSDLIVNTELSLFYPSQ